MKIKKKPLTGETPKLSVFAYRLGNTGKSTASIAMAVASCKATR
jgi:hypothetical protein